jgi:Cu+-exporting ATPase
MTVDPYAKGPNAEHEGQIYHFCSDGCRSKFVADPERYLSKTGEPEPLPRGTLYTCPMHPEIVQEGPGHCPICGMSLEPMGVPPEHEHGGHPELVDFTRRLWVGVPLSLALVVLDESHHLFGIDLLPFLSAKWEAMAPAPSRHSGRALVRLAVLRARLRVASLDAAQHVHTDCPRHGSGLPLQRGRHACPGPFPAAMADDQGTVPVYYEVAAVIVALILLGQVLSSELASAPAAPSAPLLDLAPKTALRVLKDARPRRCRWLRSRSVTSCGSGPATRFRSTARSSRAEVRSMSPY